MVLVHRLNINIETPEQIRVRKIQLYEIHFVVKYYYSFQFEKSLILNHFVFELFYRLKLSFSITNL